MPQRVPRAEFESVSARYSDCRRAQPLTLANTSWLYQKVDPPKEIKLHDIVTVIVSEKNQLISEGQVQRRRTAQYDAQLQNWIAVQGLESGWPRIPPKASRERPAI